jgi:hypothetical protein
MRRKINLVAVLVVAAFGLVACQPKTNSAVGRTGRTAGAGGNVAATSGIQLAGLVYGNDQNSFEYATQGLVSAQIDENTLGFVSAQGQGGTGVFFGGRVGVSGTLSQGTVAAGSALLMDVTDEFALQSNSSAGQALSPIYIFINQASGQISNGVATIIFQDSLGTIEFDGTINGQTFAGTVSYNNASNVDGGAGAQGTLGAFQIPACQFFACN